MMTIHNLPQYLRIIVKFHIVLVWILGCTAGWTLSLNVAPFPTQEYKLENGLKIIVREDHRAPIALTQVWYKVGSGYEKGGTTGISHALEHMMFKGTELIPAGEFSKIISENGGQQNAFTSHDYTVYYQKIDPSKLELCFKLEADRMQNLLLSAEEFAKEINVIKEERRLRIEDNPENLMQERFFAASHLNNPYQHPVIGWMSDIHNLQIEDLRNWYKTWYAPNNVVLVVVGDVVPDQVLALAKQYFEKIPKREIPSLKFRADEPSIGERRIEVNLPAQLPSLMLGYNAPNIRFAAEPWEPYGLMVLIMVLDGGNAARFTQQLIRGKNIVSSVSTWYDPFQLFPGLVSFSATPANGKSLKEVEQALLEEIKKLQTELITEQELQRVKTRVIASHIYAKDSITSQATELGGLEAIGLPWTLAEEYVKKIEDITAEQVRSLAKKYLVQENLNVAYLIPENAKHPIEPVSIQSGISPSSSPNQPGT